MNTLAYTFNSVLIKPKYSEVRTRTKCDFSTKIGNHSLPLPVISANMKAVTGAKMAATVADLGGLGLLHRFCSVEENVEMYKTACALTSQNSNRIGVSIGVKDTEKMRFATLFRIGAKIFCIDVAHGHHVLVKEMLAWINQFLMDFNADRKQYTIIAGNIATPEAYRDLCEWGADAAKVGIGPSPVCRTRFNTGVGVPQLYALEAVYEQSLHEEKPISIIADGGIGHVGDITKALKYADAVMIGSMIAGTSETPGNVFRNEYNEFYKIYGGSASGENKGESRFVEGVVKTVNFKGKVKYIFREIEWGIQGALSYTGSNNLNEFKENCEFVFLDSGSQRESKI